MKPATLDHRSRLLLAAFAPLWVVGFCLSVVQMTNGSVGYVYLTAAADTPMMRTHGVGTIRLERIREESGLRVGDRLLRAGERDLRGAGAFRLQALILEQAEAGQVSIAYTRDGIVHQTTLETTPWPRGRQLRAALMSLSFALFAVLVLVRAPRDHRSLPIYLVAIWYAIMHTPFQGGPILLTQLSFALNFVSNCVFPPLFVCSAVLWHERSVIERRLPWLLAVIGPIRMVELTGFPSPLNWAQPAFYALDAVMLVWVLVYAIDNFRRSDALGRRQVAWAGFGLVVGLAPVLMGNLFVVVSPDFVGVRDMLLYSALLIPWGFFFAIVRYDLFDIRRVFSATAAYTLLGIALLGGLLLIIPRVSATASTTLGLDPRTGETILSLVLAAVLVPGGRLLRPRIDRLFFREREALEAGVERLLVDLRGAGSVEEMTRIVGRQLDTILRPDSLAFYARVGGVYVPIFAEGPAVPLSLPADGPLTRALDGASAPFLVERFTRRRNPAPLTDAERGALDSMGTAVLIPVKRRGELLVFGCLGTKGSGDIYTSTDLARLGGVAGGVEAELLHVDGAALIRDARGMQASLRRYVPGAVAEQLEMGGDLGPAEREVSVLFVDIRAFTRLSQGRRAREIFSTVNRFTEAVTRVVRAHGGSVVEFNGDGMMAVFGAPNPLSDKERRAVAAGREMLRVVAALGAAGDRAEVDRLPIGIGIATGEAFVGSIQGADRMIWSAIGNTTNLAARLEAKTRDLDAAIVIDADTRARAGELAADFAPRRRVSIRGRRDPIDLYLLPLAERSAA